MVCNGDKICMYEILGNCFLFFFFGFGLFTTWYSEIGLFRLVFVANSPPPKPWERAGVASGHTPFKPPSAGNTSDIVESSGTANPGEIVSTSNRTATVNRNTLGRPLPSRPWEQNYGSNSYRGKNGFLA